LLTLIQIYRSVLDYGANITRTCLSVC